MKFASEINWKVNITNYTNSLLCTEINRPKLCKKMSLFNSGKPQFHSFPFSTCFPSLFLYPISIRLPKNIFNAFALTQIEEEWKYLFLVRKLTTSKKHLQHKHARPY